MQSVPLRLIASQIGCSRATVSYALRNQPGVSVTMRAKVQRLARSLGWSPDAALARQLALVRTSGRRHHPNLALVMNMPLNELSHDRTTQLQMEGAARRAKDLGYNLAVFNLAVERYTPPRLDGILRARGIEGVVYLATAEPGAIFDAQYLDVGKPYACATMGIRFRSPPYHVAIADQFFSGNLAIVQLLKAGFRRPGAVLPTALDRNLRWEFFCGLQSGAMAMPAKDRVPTCFVGSNETHLPARSFGDVLAWMESEEPDVIVTTDVLNIRKILSKGPKRVAELKVCSLDFHYGIGADFGTDERHDEVGAAAVDLVVAQLHRGERGIPRVQQALQIEGCWCVEKESVVKMSSSLRRTRLGSRAGKSKVIAAAGMS